ncbi:ABC transporter permease subunit [Rhizobium lusitanum]|uniref:ABC transporter permease subunit n=1 Tax=Rhizobium lusitanum TaxID=293958 RepID=A0A6L9UJS1_9HYPH|nr:ABC transporter permease [Rhizobium lusitanum]NEI74130.1 ABC transporter permease subunit [Rhizobium lusitanum]
MSNAYLTYAAKRLVQAVVVILLAYVFTFVVVSILPGDPVTNVLRNPQNGFTEEEIKEIIAAQGLDKPVLVQLSTSLSHFLIGDLGLSMRTNRPVTTMITEVLPSTLVLAFAALAVALLLAIVISYGTQFLPKRFGQGLLRGFPSLCLSVPNFVIGLVLIHIFGFQFGLFRVIEPDSFWATLFAAVALGIPISAQIAEVLIANLDHESGQEYAAVARSRGLGQMRLFAKHLLKPSSLPVVTVVALTVGELLGGSLITEAVFGRTGVGSLVQRSVSTQDLPVLQAVVSLAAVVFVLVNLIADLVYPLLDPRIKLVGNAEARPAAVDEGSAGISKAVTS